jgi:tRNA threonylcarbamoyl adenosine modification protein (Sua5/YciO/YrdC/YwlC family)
VTDLDDALAALLRGEVVAIPTDTVYGLVAVPTARGLIYELKDRPPGLELPVFVADIDQALAAAADVTPLARALMDRWWPGALTIVVAAASGGTVGLRVPDHDVPRELCRRAGPLVSTSANRHGAPPCTTATEVRAALPALVVIDGGTCEGAPSTVVDATGEKLALIREGRIPFAAL